MNKTMLVLALVGVASTAAIAGPKDNSWTSLKDAKWAPLDPKDTAGKGPKMTVVFGDVKKGPVGIILNVPPGFKPGLHTHTSDDYAVIVQGTVHNFKPGKDEGPGLTAGGSWFQPAGAAHDNHCEESSKDGCLIFVYMEKGFDFKPATDPAAKPADKPADKTPAKK